ncbi:PREDICTED: uncharacterized protein LOC103325406 [Prunus mume]|uniref:Uncharacterized protein LOC103325406 n=1 Tax=Prunus mume TaxID=102107 RepID=A0ABM0NJN4_PRUMU|nr:PREDICTED: uncharacterized protein LOC103325406 [Prunus mume]
MVNEQTSSDGSKLDASNPFFIHHFNHPEMMLVSKPLHGDNYTTWHRSMTVSLSAKNNAIYSTTAHEIWEDIGERFSQSNAPRIFQIQRDIASLTQDQLSVAAYYTKLKSLWDELASYSDSTSWTCGAQNERNKLMQFLMWLHESYSAIRETKDIQSFATSLLLLRSIPSHSRRYKLNVYPPGHRLHKSHTRDGSQNRGGNRSKRNGGSSSSVNLVSDGPSLHDLRSALPNLSDTQLQQVHSVVHDNGAEPCTSTPQANVAGSVQGLFTAPLRLPRWIIDSGATDHITSSSDLLTNGVKNHTLQPVLMPSGDRVKKTMIGLGKQHGGLYYRHCTLFHLAPPADPAILLFHPPTCGTDVLHNFQFRED